MNAKERIRHGLSESLLLDGMSFCVNQSLIALSRALSCIYHISLE